MGLREKTSLEYWKQQKMVSQPKSNITIPQLTFTPKAKKDNHLEANEGKPKNNATSFHLPIFLPPPPTPIRAANHRAWLILTRFILRTNTPRATSANIRLHPTNSKKSARSLGTMRPQDSQAVSSPGGASRSEFGGRLEGGSLGGG